jgi:hypothetical protein
MAGAGSPDAVRLLLPVAFAALLAAGCLGGTPPAERATQAIDLCRTAPVTQHTLYFGPALRLQNATAPAGYATGNAFSSGFLTNDLKEWLSDPQGSGLWIVGDVTLEYWVRSTGSPAPLALNPASPGQGYHFFNQFGSDRTFQPAFATEYSDVAPMAGKVDHYTETLRMPEGGFVVEAGDRVRVLLTDLALDSGSGGGHDVLFGGDTPSQVRFTARCWPELRWQGGQVTDEAVSMPANQGLLLGGAANVPKSTAANQARIPVQLPPHTGRLTVKIVEDATAKPVKDDVDINLLDRSGKAVWSIGSPYSDESGTLWADNLAPLFPDGSLTVEVESYSGVDYHGRVTVVAESALALP